MILQDRLVLQEEGVFCFEANGVEGVLGYLLDAVSWGLGYGRYRRSIWVTRLYKWQKDRLYSGMVYSNRHRGEQAVDEGVYEQWTGVVMERTSLSSRSLPLPYKLPFSDSGGMLLTQPTRGF